MKSLVLGGNPSLCVALAIGVLLACGAGAQDTAALTVTMTSEAPSDTNASPIPVTVAFSAPVTGFDATDVVLTNAQLANFSGGGADYTFDLVPIDQGQVAAEIPPGVAQDADGNTNEGAEGYVFERKWPDNDWYFDSFDGLAADSTGNVYLARCDQVLKYDPSGKLVTRWGDPKDGTVQFLELGQIAVDPADRVYLKDAYGVHVYTTEGQYVSEASAMPTSEPIDSKGNAYGFDKSYPNIVLRKCDPSGVLAGEWGNGRDDVWFIEPTGLVLDAADNVYVLDTFPPYPYLYRISAAGEVAGIYRLPRPSTGEDHRISAFTVSSSGTVYMVDAGALRVFGPSGYEEWRGQGNRPGEFLSLQSIAADQSGNVYASDQPSWINSYGLFHEPGGGTNRLNRVQELHSTRTFLEDTYYFDGNYIVSTEPWFLAADLFDNVFLCFGERNQSYATATVRKYNVAAQLLAEWGERAGSADGKFTTHKAVAVDGAGNVYVADTGNNRIQKLDASGAFLTKWGSEGTGEGEFQNVCALAVDGSGNVYVADCGNHRIQKFNADGNFLGAWGGLGSLDGQFDSPSGLAVDDLGHVYVADSGNHRIQKFDADGTFMTKWGSRGVAGDQFERPTALTVDDLGDVYVIDKGNNRVKQFRYQTDSTSLSRTYDTEPPNAPVYTGPAETSWTKPTWTWTSGGGGCYVFRCQIDDSNIGEGATEMSTLAYASPVALAYGAHTLYVQERDKAGNWSETAAFTLTITYVQPNPPTVTCITPEDDSTPTWKWVSGGGGNGTFRYRLNQGTWKQTAALSFTPSVPLADGDYALEVQERNQFGNWSLSGSATTTVTTTGTTTVPIPIPSVQGDWITADTTPTWRWTTPAGTTSKDFRYRLDGGAWVQVYNTYSFTPAASLADGPHTFEVQLLGANADWSASGSITTIVDTTAPGAPVVTGPTPTNNTHPTWTWVSAGDGNGTFRYRLDATTWLVPTTTLTSYTTSAALYEGPHSLYVQELDNLGRWSGLGSFTIDVDLTPPAPPVVTGPGNTEDTTPTWAWTSGGGGNGTYRYRLNLGPWTESSATGFTPDWALPTGLHTLSVQERDAAGNWSSPKHFTTRVMASLYDVNMSSVVDAVDLQTVLNEALGLNTGIDCDVDGNGKVDAVDVQLVISVALGIIK